MTRKEFCKRFGLTEDQFLGKEHVGGYLDLNSVTSLPDGFAPTVGGSLYLHSVRKGRVKVKKIDPMYPLTWCDGKYILLDGILSEVLAKHGNSWKTIRVGKTDVEYIVTDGDGRYAHGETMSEARDGLIYKIRDRDTSMYDGLTLDSRLSFPEAIQCYRAITGACEAGTRGFVEAHGKRESYTIREMIELTSGSWGADTFSKFFA